jgi:conjugal transfer/entry exclusion protein
VLTTYGNALAVAQSQEQELAGEDFSNIEADSAGATAVLQAIQANTEAVLADVQEQQYTRQLLAALITVEATKAGEELNERAQEEATTETQFNWGITP